MIVPASRLVMDAGISADKCVPGILWELIPKENVKAEKIIIESILGTLNLVIW